MLTSFAVRSDIAARLATEHAARLAAGEHILAVVEEGCMGDVACSVAYLSTLRDLGTPAARRLLSEWVPIALDLAREDLARLSSFIPAEA